jgi:hypothetical protein
VEIGWWMKKKTQIQGRIDEDSSAKVELIMFYQVLRI